MATIRVRGNWGRLALALLVAPWVSGCGGLVASLGVAEQDDIVRVRSTAPVRPASDPRMLVLRVTAAQPEWPGTRPLVAPPRRAIRCEQVKCVALTFDDGPYDHTGAVLDTLARYGARATFFVVGQMVTPQSTHYLRRMVSEGHEIGNHSWDHPALPSLAGDGVRDQLGRTQRAVRAATGVTMRLFRPPYGATDGKVAEQAARAGLAQIMWDVDTMDWRDRDTSLVTRRASAAGSGSVVLMHDIHKTTADAVPGLLRDLAARGYAFVTVSELYGADLVPGRSYAGRTGTDGATGRR
ncbi:polysaccharide deacetylase family protein [Sphaerisporangium sp. TRM90804]|uniref:polysaccharide deacetylase family protein n=1 Tax=Sphaerisporangium sp. TRM90804 TaxID=3031113 RepID=UPI002447DEB2|nr:polysaccharide deacetylase family protein [Sphaerisporangium sp. TRM90804]MDH2427578.1 polysaccharide deacetylase family protein [Sphaerisporangium sp. TRM90804]